MIAEQEERSLSTRTSWGYVYLIVALGAGLCSRLARAQDRSDLFNPDQDPDFCITLHPTDGDALRKS